MTPTYTPLTDAEMADLLLRWGKSFVTAHQKRLDFWNQRSDDLVRRATAARTIEEHDKLTGQSDRDFGGGFGPPSEIQECEIARAKLDAELVELQTGMKNNVAMVAFIERLLVDTAKRVALSADENELLAFKANKAAISMQRDLLAAEADTYPHWGWAWKQGWREGYLARKGENRA